MKLLDTPSRQLIERLNRRGIGSYLRVALATPWANMEEALAQVDVDEMSAEAVRAFLDLPEGGSSDIGLYTDAILTEYFGEYSSTAKSFLISSGRSEAFKKLYANFCAQWILLQTTPSAVTKVRGSLIIAGWENRDLDWAAITSTALIREATANRKTRAPTLPYWLGMFYPPPPAKARPASRQREIERPKEPERQRDPVKGKAPEVERPKARELWEIGPSGASPEPLPEPDPIRPRRRRLRRPASRGEDAGTVAIVQFPAQGPPRKTMVRIVPMDGAGRAPPVAVTMVLAQTAPRAEVTAEAPAEEEALPASEPPMA
jgi:hypothetical protein